MFAKRSIATACALAFMLTACGKESSVGVSADMSDSLGQESKSIFTRVKEMVVGFSFKKTVKVPATVLIGQAANEAMDALGENIYKTAGYWMVDSKSSDWEPIGYARFPKIEKVSRETFEKAIVELKDKANSGSAGSDIWKFKLKCAEFGAKGDIEKAQECYSHFAHGVAVIESIAFSSAPYAGWQMGVPESVQMFVAIATTDIANAVETKIGLGLNSQTMKDPDVAGVKIRNAIFEIPSKELLEMGKASKDLINKVVENRTLRIDATGFQGVRFFALDSTYKNQGAGWVIEKNGGTWFGDGHISGKKYEFSLESTVSNNLTKRKSSDQSETSGSSQSQKSDVQVK